MNRRLLAILLPTLLIVVATRGSAQHPAPDSLIIESKMRFNELHLLLRRANFDSVGIRALRLDSTVNVRFVSILPQPVMGSDTVRIVVAPIRGDRDASGLVTFKLYEGTTTQIPYSWTASRLETDPQGNGKMGWAVAGTTRTAEITLTNLANKTSRIQELRLEGNQGFTIVSISPGPLPVELPKNATFTITVAAQPQEAGREYRDSIYVKFDCCELARVPLQITTFVSTATVDESAEAGAAVTIRPHPISGSSTISFKLDRPGSVRLVVSDPSGVEKMVVERSSLAAGEQSIILDASSLAAGIYFYRLEAGDKTSVGNVLVVR